MRNPVPEYDEVPPNAPALINSMSASGYDLESAVADIIDNSITAVASTVRIVINEDGASSWIAIADNGSGMDDKTLVMAMTFGCVNPEEPRSPEDLGRFGLGLKTASLSQCKRLTVLTKRTAGKVLVRCWDKDFVKQEKKWALLRKGMTPQLEERFKKQLQEQGSGTVVLWEILDRLGHVVEGFDAARHVLAREQEGVGALAGLAKGLKRRARDGLLHQRVLRHEQLRAGRQLLAEGLKVLDLAREESGVTSEKGDGLRHTDAAATERAHASGRAATKSNSRR